HKYAEESAADHAGSNPYQTSVTVSHGTASPTTTSASQSAQATVSDPSVLATGGLTFSAVEGGTLASGQVVATFTDPGGAEAVGDYTADIDFGDGGGVHAGAGTISFKSTSGTFTVTSNIASAAYAEEGNKPLTVTVHHEGAQPVTVSDA